MTTVTSQNLLWGPVTGQPVGYSPASMSLNDADNSVAMVLSVPRDGTIDKIGVNVTTLTGNPPAYNVGLVTVDTGGYPTTTAYGGGAITENDFTGTGWTWVTLGTAAVGTAGDIVAARVWPNLTAGTPNASNYAAVSRYPTPGQWKHPQTFYYTTGWLRYTALSVGIMYSDGSICLPSITSGHVSYDTGSDPDEIGVLFQVPFACVCVGAVIYIMPEAAAADFTITLYNAANDVLATITADQSQTLQSSTSPLLLPVYWDAVTLAADTDYRLTVLPTSTSNVSLSVVTVNEVASRSWWPEGARWQQTGRTDAGAWTETTTKLPMLGVILSSFDLPTAGTAAGTATGWAGGMMIG